MHLDASDLRTFYYRTRLGRAAQKAVRDRLMTLWPPRANETVVGFGFAVPLLRPYLASAARVTGLMPAQQGVMAWPVGAANHAVLCEETLWPIATGTVDRLVLLHGLETSESPSAVLDEAWRVLAPGGRAVFIVPNRAGLWSRWDGTPFGFGRPYTAGQLEAELRRHDFTTQRTASALFAPPSNAAFWLRSADVIERLGARVVPWRAGGVLIAEARKSVPAPRQSGRLSPARRLRPIVAGVGAGGRSGGAQPA